MQKKFGYLSKGALNARFATFGYRSLYIIGNLNWIFIFGIFALLLLVLAYLKDSCVKRTRSVREKFWLESHGPWMHNFTLRFVYEAFFELILCAMISLSKRQTYTGDNF